MLYCKGWSARAKGSPAPRFICFQGFIVREIDTLLSSRGHSCFCWRFPKCSDVGRTRYNIWIPYQESVQWDVDLACDKVGVDSLEIELY
jgi:hypothetical protein